MFELLLAFWQYIFSAFVLVVTAVAVGHAMLYKRDHRSSAAWVAFILLIPLLGAVFYYLLGVNRIRRRAASVRADLVRYQSFPGVASLDAEDIHETLPPDLKYLKALAGVVHEVTGRPLLSGNRVVPCVNGDEAYPQMLEAIARAERSVTLSTYIFDNDQTGGAFIDALSKAKKRGAEVRVLIDDMGARYSWPSAARLLAEAGVPAARFIPMLTLKRLNIANLRCHRKILVVDGRVGFTGGMNIRDAHKLSSRPKKPVQDLHFRIEGPVVAHLQEVFADDWLFTTGEPLRGEAWFPPLAESGEVLARGVSDGPDEDLYKLRWVLLGALACAESSVQIVTPYFLPDQALITSLDLAAMRGIEVDIFLPEKCNLRVVQWASNHLLWQVLEHGCRVWRTPPPFDHSKLMIVDDHWTLLGSSNWDPRTLRLNFEFNVECYDSGLAARLSQIVRAKRQAARPVTIEELDGRSLPVKIRDGTARLFMPYL
jgi:cardiolipin synthase